MDKNTLFPFPYVILTHLKIPYSDRIKQDDREKGVGACQSMCERVFGDKGTFWIFLLQEQTCECWGKITPEEYLGNCTERAWYPTPKMSEISKDGLCHAKTDHNECTVIYKMLIANL